MMKFKKSELVDVLLHLCSVDKDGVMIGGLMSETISLGLKRRLQKIHKDAYKEYQEFIQDQEAIKLIKDPDEKAMEMKQLLEEEVTINQEMADLGQIETITTAKSYDFDIIEKFAK